MKTNPHLIRLRLSQRLRKIRTEQGISLYKMEEITKMDKTNISEIERALKNYKIDTLIVLADALGHHLELVKNED